MTEFYINTDTVTRQSSRLSDVANSVKGVQAKVSDAKNGLAGIGLAAVTPAIIALEARLARHVGKANQLSSVLGTTLLKYIAAESEIMGIPVFLNPDFQSVAGTVFENAIDALGDTNIPFSGLFPGGNTNIFSYDHEVDSVLLPFLQHHTVTWGDMQIDLEHGSITFGQHELGIGFATDSEILHHDFECHENEADRNWIDNHRREYSWDGNSGDFSQASTVHSLSAEATASVSAWAAEGELSGRYGSLSGNVSVLNAEASASAYAGLFSEDGRFAPGIGAEFGLSASLFEAEGEARLGNNYLGAYVTGQAEVGSVSATASIDAGLYDENGNFHPSLGAGVEAEAIAAQVSGSAGVTVLGTDVGVTGSIGFGAGAHANVGLQDGVLSVDVGAYLGVGASVGFELDLNDTFDTIQSAYNDVADWASDTVDAVSDWASDTADAVSDWASDTADAVSDWASNTWDAITFWD